MTDERAPNAGDDSFDDSPLDGDESLQDFQKRTVDDDDEPDDGDLSDDEEDGEPPDSDSSVDAVINFIGQQEALKQAQEAERADFNAKVATYMPDYQPPEELTPVERAAQQAAALVGTNNFEEFAQMLRTANAETERKARAGTQGFDRDGAPSVPPFNPMTLDGPAFAAYARAAASGGASMRDVPSGWTYDDWVKAVDSGLGKE